MIRLAFLFTKKVAKDKAKYIVPYECNDGFVGINFIKQLAADRKGVFNRNTSGIGLMSSFDLLNCNQFDTTGIHPWVKDFYERTTDYELELQPKWNVFFKPLYWLFRKIIAEKVGNANLPFNQKETAEGIVTYIDTIDFNNDEIPDLRGWIRTYKKTGDVIYVGIYTTVKVDHQSYVSVGFPFQEVNLTATLAPVSKKNGTLLLTTKHSSFKHAGDYLVSIDEQQQLSIFKLKWFHEEIKVFVKNERLLTDHKFYFLFCNFLTLKYRLIRKQASTDPA